MFYCKIELKICKLDLLLSENDEQNQISSVEVHYHPWNHNLLWDAHFKVSCLFNAIVNRNCLCEHHRK